MNLNPNLQLTYIPSQYWNADVSKFNVFPKNTKIPKNTSFFILWIPNLPSEDNLIKEINKSFPKIPIETLISCNINLAILNKEHFKIQEVKAKILPLIPAARLLNELQIFESKDRNKTLIQFSNSIKIWALLTKLVFELLNRGDFIPLLEKDKEEKFKSFWNVILKFQQDNERFNYILQNSSWEAYNLPANIKDLDNSSIPKEDQYVNELWHPSYVFSNYINTIGDLLIRFILKTSNFKTFEEYYNPDILKERNKELNLSWDYKFLKSLIKKDKSFKIIKLHETIIPKLVNNWTSSTQISTIKYGIRLTIKLEYPKDNNQNDWLLKFYISSQDSKKLIPLDEFWIGKKKISNLSSNIQNREELVESILKSLYIASVIYPPLSKALNNASPKDIILDSTEVMKFLSYPKDLLIQNGFNIILPDVFNIGGKQRLSTRIVLSMQKKEVAKGKSTVLNPIFQLHDLVNYKWQIELDNAVLKQDEVKNIVKSDQPLINWRGEWILVDQQDLDNLTNILNPSIPSGALNQTEGKINYMDALKLGLSGSIQLEEGINYKVVIEGDLNNIINKIKTINKFEKISTPLNFKGELRAYQKDGLTWMANMCELNFGLCLADDMGLGKTIQIIALLLYFKEKYTHEFGSTLIICPTSVLYNWKHEINKFAPDLDVILHHGPNRVKDISELTKILSPHKVILTSYATIRNDIELFKIISFSGVIVDESQNMKNYETQQTQAIYQLQSHYKVCLSGTPIENHLMELWTLFNFLNPGLLSDRKEFQEKVLLPIERYYDKKSIEKLKKVIAPFILRRVKTNKSIIKDLPDKNEMKIYTELSKEQSSLYQNLVKEALKQLNNTSNKKNNMFILSLLTKFKQICNHPYQYSKKTFKSNISNKDYRELISQSPKLERLLEMINDVIANNEKTIIFTQFTQMGDLLEKFLNFKYNFPILYFHGSIPAEKRKIIIEEFQSDNINSSPILILSLKAGGTGLNLTKATTVFHFDRWWNPAVEKQATDRAYRIGQTKNVNVYKFITLGTIEEKIDALIEEKKELADTILTSGESWLSQLSNDKIKELISLK